MRIWLHGGTRSLGLVPSGTVSVIAHAAIIGGAVYGTSHAPPGPDLPDTERIYYLPPPDRMVSSRPIAERVRYLAVSAGASEDARSASGAPAPARRGDEGARAVGQDGEDDVTRSAQAALATTSDSVYSILEVEEGAARVEGSAAPVYPAELLAQHIEGVVHARYVIDSTGHTEPGSVQITDASHPGFVQAVRDAIPLMRFSPATVAGRHVRQEVEQDFAFRITASPVTPAVPAEHTRARPTP